MIFVKLPVYFSENCVSCSLFILFVIRYLRSLIEIYLTATRLLPGSVQSLFVYLCFMSCEEKLVFLYRKQIHGLCLSSKRTRGFYLKCWCSLFEVMLAV